MKVSLGEMKDGKIRELAVGHPETKEAPMTTKDDYQEIGRTKDGERVLRNRKNGCICTEKDNLYRTLSTRKEMEEVGIALIEESCGGMQVWIPIGERPDGKKTFGNTKDGRLAVRTGKNRMELIEEDIKE